jgi:hypothetical protein
MSNFYEWAVDIIQAENISYDNFHNELSKERLLKTFQKLPVELRFSITPYNPANYFRLKPSGTGMMRFINQKATNLMTSDQGNEQWTPTYDETSEFWSDDVHNFSSRR